MRENIYIKRLLIFKEKQLLRGEKQCLWTAWRDRDRKGSDSYSMAQQTPPGLTAKKTTPIT